MKIDHINISAPMTLLEATRDFYCEVLELEVGPRPDFGIPGYWLYGDGRAIVHLIESDVHQRAPAPHYLDHVAFEVHGLKAYTERLDRMGVAYEVRHLPDFNIAQVFCEDPCGIRIEANIRD